jgi:hypothetical protein
MRPNVAFLILALSNLGPTTSGSLCIELGKAVIMMLLSSTISKFQLGTWVGGHVQIGPRTRATFFNHLAADCNWLIWHHALR